jgi:hypothetical protein
VNRHAEAPSEEMADGKKTEVHIGGSRSVPDRSDAPSEDAARRDRRKVGLPRPMLVAQQRRPKRFPSVRELDFGKVGPNVPGVGVSS